MVGQRKAQGDIIAAETRRSQIISALEGVEGRIGQIKVQIKELEADQAEYTAKKDQLVAKINGEENMKAKLLAELEKVNGELAAKMKQIAEYKEKCASI